LVSNVKQSLLEKFAKLAVRVGVNIQEGQILRIICPLEVAELARCCQKEAYLAKAKKVVIEYRDELARKTELEMASEEALCEFPKFKEEEMLYYINEGFAVLHIYAETPGLLKDIDAKKMQTVMMANAENLLPMHDYTLSNQGQWCIVSYPTVGWAKKVFPDLDDDKAVQKLWDNILTTVRIDEDNDIIDIWQKHNKTLARHNKILNDYSFDYLLIKNSLGTDLKLHLAKNHLWAGGAEKSAKGIEFNPNMPTEECFTMPYKTKVDGKVVASKPLNYQGKLIEDFYLVFKDGKVVDYDAKKEKEALKNLIEFDEGSSYLGEVALISYDSPISNTGILFYNTLFDENASCHLALGSAYPMNIKDSDGKKEEELFEFGFNKSMTHEDFMFGTADLDIIGYTYDGKEVKIFENGNFVF